MKLMLLVALSTVGMSQLRTNTQRWLLVVVVALVAGATMLIEG